MIAASLPPAPSPTSRTISRAEKLAQLPSPTSVKTAWQRAAQSNPSSPSPLSPRTAQGKTSQQRTPALPNESFVLLQDSVVRKIPSPAPSPSHPKKPSTSKSRQNVPPGPPSASQEEVNHPNPSPLSHHLRSTLRLFNLLSSRTELDHPLCSECTQSLLETLTKQLEETKKERDGYIAFEKEVRKEREREREGPSKAEVDSKIEKLKDEERIAIEQLKTAEKERMQLEEELKALELEEKALEEEEAEFVSHFCLIHEESDAPIASGENTMRIYSSLQSKPLNWRRSEQRTLQTLQHWTSLSALMSIMMLSVLDTMASSELSMAYV